VEPRPGHLELGGKLQQLQQPVGARATDQLNAKGPGSTVVTAGVQVPSGGFHSGDRCWPRRVAQEPINVGDADYHPRYPYGFGLRTR
jgi:hypothetical protein